MNTLKNCSRYFLQVFSIILLLFMINACGTEAERGSEKLFESDNIAPGETFSYTFRDEGTVDYFCEIHPTQMQATISVTEGADISERDTVVMENLKFNPDQLTIAPNTVIVWINRNGESHTVVSGNPSTGNDDVY